MLVPAFVPGAPGGPELLIILFLLVLLFAPAILIAAAVAVLLGRNSRVSELEERLAELEGELDGELEGSETERSGGEASSTDS